MNKNEAENVIRETIEYANHEIKKTKSRYRRNTLIVFFILLAGIIIFSLAYTRPMKIGQRYPYLDLSQCYEIKGYYFVATGTDDVRFEIQPTDEGFEELIGMIESAEIRKKVNNLLPIGNKMHTYTDGDYKWDLIFCFDGINLPDGSAVNGSLFHINNFFGELSFSVNGEYISCFVNDQEEWIEKVMDIISQYKVE